MILLAGEPKVVAQKEETESSAKTLAQESDNSKASFCFSPLPSPADTLPLYFSLVVLAPHHH